MKKKAFIPMSVLMGALLLALAAAMALFVAEPDRVHAQQTSTDSSLSNLTLSAGKLTPDFTKTDYDYTAKVKATTSSITVKGTPNIQGSSVAVFYSSSTFNAGENAPKPNDVTDASGGTVPLLANSTRYIGIEVTALNGTSKSVYRVDVTRVSSNASNDAKLSALSINAGTLSPTFDKDKKSYTALVANSQSMLEVTPTITSNANSTFVITSDKDSAIATQGSGSATTVDLSAGANVITIKVTSQSLTKTESYKLTVTRAAANASDDAGLSDIQLSSGLTLNPAFKSSTTQYTVKVPHSKTQTTVTPKKNNSAALTVVTPVDFNKSTSAHEVFLGVGDTVITIAVTAENATTTSTYRVTVTRAGVSASDKADLTALTIAGTGENSPTTAPTLSPGFNKGVTSYTTLVSNGTTGLSVTPTSEAGATFVITSDKDSTIATQGSGSATSVDLSAGANVIKINVMAADFETKKTYTLTATRAAANASDDSRLSALTVGGKDVSVSGWNGADTGSDAVDYRTGVANDVDSIAIKATQSDSDAIVAIKAGGSESLDPAESGWVVDSDGTVDLVVGANRVLIEVTAEDGSTVGNYFLVITRASAGASSDAKLSNLVIGAGTLSPGFDKDVMSYTALVANSSNTITVTPTITSNANSTFVITSDKDSTIATSGSGENTTVDLSEGANVITINVTAQDLATTESYTLTVTRAAANASDDAGLSALTVGGKSVSVSGFNGIDNTADHSTGVANGVNSIEISATANHSGAMVVIKKGVSLSDSPGGTVDADGTVDLTIGANNILIEVTAEDGSTKRNYFLVITRASAGADTDAKLDALALTRVTYSPVFNENTTMYSAEVPENITATTITATAATTATSVVVSSDRDDDIGADSNSETHITIHSIDLSGGDNVITIVVTAADYATTKTYTVTVVRGVSNNANLSALSLEDSAGTDIALTVDVARHWDSLDCAGMNDRVGADDQPDDATSPYCAMYADLGADAKAKVDATYSSGFSSDVNMYSAEVDVGVNMIEVTAATASDDATKSVMYGASDTVVTPVAGSYSIPLTAGENTIKVVVTAEDGTTTATYTVIVTSAQLALFDAYDVNDNGRIDKSEALTAIDDYLRHRTITKDQVLEIINLYLGVSS